MENEINNLDVQLNDILSSLPNLPNEDVPIGKDESSNKLIKKVGDIPSYSFKPKPHYELGENLKMLDFEQASKVSGTRFVYLKNQLAKLERAIANYMLDKHTNSCLLYTSPSPRDATLSRMPSSA